MERSFNIQSTEWFHGSPEVLTHIRAGSSISPTKNVARGFSYRPEFLDVSTEGNSIRHNGTRGGYLYVVDERLTEADVRLHDASKDDPWFEWLVNRDVQVRLLEQTEVIEAERMSDDEIATYRARLAANNNQNFLEKRD